MSRQQTDLLFHTATPGLARRDARRFAQRLQAEVASGRGFCCLITNNRELRRLNREFRKKDYATDVLSFPVMDQNGFLGEIAISIDKAREQAAEHGHSTGEEIAILMLHGLLHLVGMDHETDRGQMARAERKWRANFGLPAGLIERGRA